MGQFAIENGDAQAVLRFDTPAHLPSVGISFAVDMDGSDTAVKLLDIRYGCSKVSIALDDVFILKLYGISLRGGEHFQSTEADVADLTVGTPQSQESNGAVAFLVGNLEMRHVEDPTKAFRVHFQIARTTSLLPLVEIDAAAIQCPEFLIGTLVRPAQHSE